MACPIPQGGHK